MIAILLVLLASVEYVLALSRYFFKKFIACNNDTTQNIVLLKLVNLFKYKYGQKGVFCFIFSASG